MPKRPAVQPLVLSFLALFAAAVLLGQSSQRNITGTVTFNDDEPVRGAAVQLKNLTTLQVSSYLTQKDGKYQFFGLPTETDYELLVLYKGKFSNPKRVEKFNSHTDVVVNFRITPPSD